MTPLSITMASDGGDDDYNSIGTINPNAMKPDGFEEQMSQLHDMVNEMKDGFLLATQELSRIQHGDQELTNRVENSERQSQQMIQDLTNSVQQLKTDLSTVLEEMKKNSETTKQLSEQVHQLQDERLQLLDEIQQKSALQNEISRNENRFAPHTSRSDSDNNNSDSGKPQSNPDSSRSDWEAVRDGRRMSPMLQPFIDSLPDGFSGNIIPPCDSDSESSATKAAIHMLRMGNTLREKYRSQRQDALLALDDSDDPHDILAQQLDEKEGGTLTRKDIESASSKDGNRLNIAQELFSSEETYISQLRFLKEKIVNPLIVGAVFSLSDINLMFPPCLNKLYQKHCTLLGTLESRLSHWKYQGMLGDIFARLTTSDGSEFLQLYRKYILNFSASLSALSKQTNMSSRFQTFLKNQLSQCSKEESDLTVYLLAPIQRIPSYVLCLQQLLRCTDSSHPDYFHIDTCLKQFNEFIINVNALIDHPVNSRKSSYSSHSSTETALSKKSCRDSGVYSPDEFAANGSLVTLQSTWNNCLNTNKFSKSSKLPSGRESEQKDKANKDKLRKADRTSHKPRSKTKPRPKLEKCLQSMVSCPSWGDNSQSMNSQQTAGVFGIQGSTRPMFVSGQMMPNDIQGMTAAHVQQSPGIAGASNSKNIVGRGFDPRLCGQARSASTEEISRRRISQSSLDYFKSEKDEVVVEVTGEKEEEGESTNILPTPQDSASRKVQFTNDGNERNCQSARSPMEKKPFSPIRDAPPIVYVEPGTDNAQRGSRSSFLSNITRSKVQRSQTRGDYQGQISTPRNSLSRSSSLKSVYPGMPTTGSLTDVLNDGAPTEIDQMTERRKSVQDNCSAVLQSPKNMDDRVRSKTSITNSIKSLFKGKQSAIALTSQVKEMPANGKDHQANPIPMQDSTAAVFGFSFDENGDLCSDV